MFEITSSLRKTAPRVWLAALALLLPAAAGAQVIQGTPYRVGAINLPTTWGWETVRFDGVPETVQDGLIRVDEREHVVPEGVWVEIGIERTDGQPIVGAAARSELAAVDLDHGGPSLWINRIGNWYGYFTIDGNAAPLPAAPNGELRPHPFDPSVGDVWFSDNLGAAPLIFDPSDAVFVFGRLVAPPGTTGVRVGGLQRAVPADRKLGFDVQLLDLQITGQNAFADDFEDGLRQGSPTARLIDVKGTTREAGGALQLRSDDGTSIQYLRSARDLVLYEPLFHPGRGNAEVTARIAPLDQSYAQQAFSLIFDPFDLNNPMVLSIEWNTEAMGYATACGSGLQATFRIKAHPMYEDEVVGCDAIDPASLTGDLVLRLAIRDDVNQIHGFYSTDGGASFTGLGGFDVPYDPPLILLQGEPARLFLAASGAIVTRDFDGDGFVFDLCPEDPDPVQLLFVDGDGDRLGDVCDPCKTLPWSDGLDLDRDGNGLGDHCECGDANGDGLVNVSDLVRINTWIMNPAPFFLPNCDTNYDQRCDVSDIVGANARIYGAEAHCVRNPPPSALQ